jgi:glutaredoxin 3
MKRIEIYGSKIKGKECPYCQKAISFCEENKIPFDYIDITDNKDLQKAFIKRSNNAKSVPQIFVEDYIIGGYEQLVKANELGIIQQIIGGE